MRISEEALAAVSAVSARDEPPALPFAESPECALWKVQAEQRRAQDLAESLAPVRRPAKA